MGTNRSKQELMVAQTRLVAVMGLRTQILHIFKDRAKRISWLIKCENENNSEDLGMISQKDGVVIIGDGEI